MEATLQALGTLPEENFLVLRFLTAFLVEVRPQARLYCSSGGRRGGGREEELLPLLFPGVGAGGRARGFLLQPPDSLHRFLPTLTTTR